MLAHWNSSPQIDMSPLSDTIDNGGRLRTKLYDKRSDFTFPIGYCKSTNFRGPRGYSLTNSHMYSWNYYFHPLIKVSFVTCWNATTIQDAWMGLIVDSFISIFQAFLHSADPVVSEKVSLMGVGANVLTLCHY